MAHIIFGTHNGPFHADDAMAAAIVRMGQDPRDTMEIVRTRDYSVLAGCDVVADVGGVYNPEARRYDHHQRTFTDVRESGIKYSSAGLLWKHEGLQAIGRWCSGANRAEQLDILRKVDDQMIAAICAADNGQRLHESKGLAQYLTISGMVSQMNPTWDESGVNADASFDVAVDLCLDVLHRMVKNVWAEVKAAGYVRRCLNTPWGFSDMPYERRVLLMTRYAPWQATVCAEESPPLYVIFPSTDGTWMVQATPESEHSFACRKPLPEAWAGLRDEELQTLTGVNEAVFCHIGRFICGAKTLTGAIVLVLQALES